MRRRIVLAASVVSLSSLLGLSPAEAERGHSRHGLVGTWEVVVDNSVSPPFDVLESYIPGGVVIVSADAPPPPGQSIGSGHGSWRQIGHRRYQAIFKRFHYDAASGEFLFTLKVEQTIKLNRRSSRYEGKFTFELILPDGTIIEPSPGGTTTGVRLRAD